MSRDLAMSFCGIRFRNPVVVASTDIGRSPEQVEAFARAGVGGIVIKSVTDAAPLQNAGITMFDIRDMDQRPVERGEIQEGRIDASVRRILVLKLSLGLLEGEA